MKSNLAIALAIIVPMLLLLALAVFGNYIGYAITLADSAALVGLAISLIASRNEIKNALSKRLNSHSLAILAVILIFFLAFSALLLPKTELIFFDENIYQGVALNILHSANSQMCEYGLQFAHKCFVNGLGFDPSGWPLLLAIAFGIFGPSNAASYNLELLMGAIAIVSVFLAASMLAERKAMGPVAASIFALIPELFIWSKTLANPDMPFLAFASLDVMLFLVFLRSTKKRTFLALAFALAFTIYIRVQAALLIPVFLAAFLIFGNSGVKNTFRARARLLSAKIYNEREILLVIVVFLVLIVPQICATIATGPELRANAEFYLYPNTETFSASYVPQTLLANLRFLAGLLKDYPITYIPNLTVFAVLGALFLLFRREYKNSIAILLFLSGLFSIYFIFFLLYFSGSVLVGVSVRYLLILYPALSMLSAFAIIGIGDVLYGFAVKGRKTRPKQKDTGRYLLYTLLVLLFFALPFAYFVPILRNPTFNYYGFPLNNVTSRIQGLNPYTTGYSKTDSDFINSNYKLVPPKCLVISGVPSLWFMLNRSSSYIAETDVFTNSSFSGYGCYYFDYGFWCTVSPYNTTICNYYMTNYNMRMVATQSSGRSANFSIYRIVNYTK